MSGGPALAERFREIAARHSRCFWLDGAAGRAWSGRRSYVGWLDQADVSLTYDVGRRLVHRHQGGRSEVVGSDPFEVLAGELAAGPADAEWIGYFGYAARSDLPAAAGRDLPDAVWMRPSHLEVVEHGGPVPPGLRAGTVPEAPDPRRAALYDEAFSRVRGALHAGDSYEVNLTYRVEVEAEVPPYDAYVALREANPAPYAAFLQHDLPGARAWLLSSSPERFLRVDSEGRAETRPIKGTTPRGATAALDAELRAQLATDPRFRAENLMIVDLLRNDLATVCRPGTVEVPGLMEVESYASVHQLVSTVSGTLRPEVSAVEAVRALFPPGSMTGAPKLRTMEIIDAVEDSPRGAYAGAFGRIAASGECDLGVTIRSLTTDGSGTWELGTGGGITVHSDVDSELEETRVKAARVLGALAAAERARRASNACVTG